MYSCACKSNKQDLIITLLEQTGSFYDTVETLRSQTEIPSESLIFILQNIFGIPEFRPNQLSIIQSLLTHHSCVFISPTGSGKSLTYQLPALLFRGISLVISPLISLMHDQEHQLPPILSSLVLTGSLSPRILFESIKAINSGIIKIIYISPEKLFSSMFRELLHSTSLADQIDLVVVDEAHCISSWSFNFRSDYLRLFSMISLINQSKKQGDFYQSCSVLGLTGTGGIRVKEVVASIEFDDRISANIFRFPRNRSLITGGIVATSKSPRCRETRFSRVNSTFFGMPKIETITRIPSIVVFRFQITSKCDCVRPIPSRHHVSLRISSELQH
ncbi:uncharacterized protein [Blastocystis hominis]|uniref:Helicase ATP-binding domain-containing protein n=1 Tax=Blastocystis hominis TaxID=12968 RepID=D8LXU9_BLAHO|nr:uncharacterized protein [Blastocystis hominis]CBK20404.2 unnamed protein product [Blastocystis hominis]|eukprot:XP_012894452.1 uncharacterized protein [Blastocystis hominis]